MAGQQTICPNCGEESSQLYWSLPAGQYVCQQCYWDWQEWQQQHEQVS